MLRSVFRARQVRWRFLGGLAFALSALLAGEAAAQVDARVLSRALLSHAPERPLSVVVELPSGAASPPGLVAIGAGLSAFHGSVADVLALAEAHPDWSLSWAPPRRPLLDVADKTTRAAMYRGLTGQSGKGVVVGVVDTGFDPRHADLRDATGKSRVAWALDLSREPLGRHPELEAEYGCTGGEGYACAVYSGADLDELIAKDSVQLPRDTLGHGTHVASLAAGNGLSQSPAVYTGMAPEATLVGVRVTRTGEGAILDPDVLLATRFVFERAQELGAPAVVNLSLGSDFGGHDGQTVLERGLASFVGKSFPGRAIVVAAGNSGGIYSGEEYPDYPPPFGIHTEVHVPRASSLRVPVLSPNLNKPSTNATIYIWIAGRPGDELSVGVDDQDGEWIEPLEPGRSAAYSDKGIEVTILNRVGGDGSPIQPGSNGAVVVLDGTWSSGSVFAIRLEGHGSARLWLQSEGDLTPGGSNPGALFPRASKEGTIGIPATGADLISVGATLNRVAWIDHQKKKIVLDQFGSLTDPKADSSAYFSGAGPNSLGQMKPDLVAPGAFVVGAMSALADPRKNGGGGIFAGGGVCNAASDCLVVDDFHAISSGTSMAAPIVSGAVALLLERDSSLDQSELRTLLQAGARSLDGSVLLEQQVGPGELDLVGTLTVMGSEKSPLSQVPDVEESWVALASSYAHPDPDWPLEGVLELRASDESIADIDPSRLSLSVEGARPTRALARVAPGLWRFAVAAPSGSGGGTLTLGVLLDGQPFLTRSVPIAVDRAVADGGVDARGGCSQHRGALGDAGWPWAFPIGWWLSRRRRRRNDAR